MGARDGHMLIHAQWPALDIEIDDTARSDINWIIELVREIRSVRVDLGLPPAAKLALVSIDPSEPTVDRLKKYAAMFRRPAGLGAIAASNQNVLSHLTQAGEFLISGGAIELAVKGETFLLHTSQSADISETRARLTKSAEAAEKEAASLAGRLNNPAFVEKAKPEAVEKTRADYAEKSAEAERLRAALTRLG